MARLSTLILATLIICVIGIQGKPAHKNRNANVNNNRFSRRNFNSNVNNNEFMRRPPKRISRTDTEESDVELPEDLETDDSPEQIIPTRSDTAENQTMKITRYQKKNKPHRLQQKPNRGKSQRGKYYVLREGTLADDVINCLTTEFGSEIKEEDLAAISDSINSIFNGVKATKRKGRTSSYKKDSNFNSNRNSFRFNQRLSKLRQPSDSEYNDFFYDDNESSLSDSEDIDADVDMDLDFDGDDLVDALDDFGGDLSTDERIDAGVVDIGTDDNVDIDSDDDSDSHGDHDGHHDHSQEADGDENSNTNTNTNQRRMLNKNGQKALAKLLKRAGDGLEDTDGKPGKGKGGSKNVNSNNNQNVFRRSLNRNVNTNKFNERRKHKG